MIQEAVCPTICRVIRNVIKSFTFSLICKSIDNMIRDRAFLTTYSIIRNAMRCFTASLISKAIDNVAREDVCLTIYRAIHDAISNQLVSFHVAFAAFGCKLHERAFKSQESKVSTEQPTRRLKLPQEYAGSRAGPRLGGSHTDKRYMRVVGQPMLPTTQPSHDAIKAPKPMYRNRGWCTSREAYTQDLGDAIMCKQKRHGRAFTLYMSYK